MWSRRHNLVLLEVGALLSWAAVVFGTTPALRAIPAVFLVLIAPGAALSAALIPDRRPDPVERLLLALGTSLAVVILAAVALDAAGAALTATTIATVLTLVTVAGGLVAQMRRQGHLASSPRARSAGYRSPGWPASIAVAAAAVVLLAAAVALARLPTGNVLGYTLLWALPRALGGGRYTVGVRCEELHATSYVLTARSGGKVVLRRRLTVLPGNQWHLDGRVSAASLVAGGRLSVVLARASEPDVTYRRALVEFGSAGG